MRWRELPSAPNIFENEAGDLMVRFRERTKERTYDVKRKAKSLEHALQIREEILRELDQSESAKLTVQRYYRTIWVDWKSNQVRPHTLKKYRECLDRDIMPLIGLVKVSSLSKRDCEKIRDYYAENAANGTFAKSTIQTGWATFSMFVREMVDACDLPANPASTVRLKSATNLARQRKEYEALTAAECVAFLEATQYVPNLVDVGALWLGLSTGVHFAEYTAARWDDVGLDGKLPYLTVQRSQVRGVIADRPKTQARKRSVWLFPEVAEILKRIKEQNKKSAYVIPDAKGAVKKYPTSVRKALVKSLQIADIKKELTIHKLRAQFNTLALSAGIPDARIKMVMGHSARADMTMRYDLRKEVAAFKEVQEAAVGDIIREAGKTLGLSGDKK